MSASLEIWHAKFAELPTYLKYCLLKVYQVASKKRDCLLWCFWLYLGVENAMSLFGIYTLCLSPLIISAGIESLKVVNGGPDLRLYDVSVLKTYP